MSDKPRFPLADAQATADAIVASLRPYCLRIIIAGSIRRGKATVGDIEILYIPKVEMRPVDMFHQAPMSLVAEQLDTMIAMGIIEKRLSVKGAASWGEKNKLARHRASGIPVDFFATTEAAWYNYLVCRTGPAESNMKIAQAAHAKGLKWTPYGPGFSDAQGNVHACKSEMEVFHHVGLTYLSPEIRA